MNVAYVCGNFWPDSLIGSMVSTDALARSLARRHSVDIICGDDGHYLGSRPYRILPVFKFPYLSFHPSDRDCGEREIAATRLQTYFEECSRFLRGKTYDVIDAQGPWCSAATIVTVRFVYIEYLELLAATEQVQFAEDPWSKTLCELEGRTYQALGVRNYIAVSEKAKEELCRHYAIPTEQVSVVNNGVDPQKFSLTIRKKYRQYARRQFGVSEKEFVIAYSGNNYVRKNLKTFLATVRPYYRRGVRLALLAEPTREMTLLTNEDRNNIVFYKKANSPEIVLAGCDMLLFPTLYDTCAKIVLETMALGVPVVVSHQSGLGSVIVNGENGYIVSSSTDVAQYRRLLSLLLIHDALRKEIGLSAATTVHSKLTWDHIATKVEKIYSDCGE